MPFSYDEIARYQWLAATQAVTLAEAEVSRMIYWCKSPNDEEIPNLIEMISLWAEASDKSDRLDQTPIVIDDAIKEELANSGVLEVSDISDKRAELDGFMTASENFKSDLYQRTLNEQLVAEIDQWRKQLRYAKDQTLNEEELDELLSTRDYLEYARMGIHVIRMERRLLNVNYSQFADKLADLDGYLKDILKNYDPLPLPYAPSTAWWRKES